MKLMTRRWEMSDQQFQSPLTHAQLADNRSPILAINIHIKQEGCSDVRLSAIEHGGVEQGS